MFFHPFVAAAALLTTPVDSLEISEAVRLAPYVQAVALAWEILDPREVKAVLTHDSDHAADLRMLQERLHNLKEAPGVEEALRFPTWAIINERISFNRAFHQDLNRRLTFDRLHAEVVKAALAENDQLYRVWDTLRDARCEDYYLPIRRQALQTLRELIGAEAFYSGRLPPHVPVWRFAEAP